MPTFEISLEYLWCHRPACPQPRLVARRELDANLRGDRPRNLALDAQDVADVALVALRPETLLGVSSNELQRDADAVAGALYRPLEHVVDTNLGGDLGKQL